jgi:hypothetical protein
MPLMIYLRKDDILTINGIRIQALRRTQVAVLDRAEITFPEKRSVPAIFEDAGAKTK